MQSVTGYLGLALLFTWDSPGVVRCAWGGMLPLGWRAAPGVAPCAWIFLRVKRKGMITKRK